MSLILLNFSFYKIFRYVFDIVILDFFCFSSLCFYITLTQSRFRRNLASTQFSFRRNLFRRNLGFDAIYSTQFARRSLGLAQLSISRLLEAKWGIFRASEALFAISPPKFLSDDDEKNWNLLCQKHLQRTPFIPYKPNLI